MIFLQGIIKVDYITHYTFALLKRLHLKDYLQQLERFSEFLPLVTGGGVGTRLDESPASRDTSVKYLISSKVGKVSVLCNYFYFRLARSRFH